MVEDTKDKKNEIEFQAERLEAVAPTGNPDLTEDDLQFLASFDDSRQKKLIRKIDWRLVPLLTLLYLISYIDRANIGNAKIEGLADDLKLSGTEYNVALSIFFIAYILLEVPSNSIIMRTKRPSYYIGGLMMSWGVVMTLTGIVQNFAGLVITRFFLGACEAGFFPGAVYIISRWYLPGETQARIAAFYCGSALAGAFSGLLAFAIAKMDGVAGLEGWRWIFLLEGIASVAAGVLCAFCLIDVPTLSGRWLEPDEMKYLELRQIAAHGNTKRIKEQEKTRKWQIVRSVLFDWQLYLQGFVYWSNTAPNYGLKFSMPQIIANMGFTSAKAQLLTIPPYFVGAISAYSSAILSDRFKWRMPFIVGPQLLVVVAFAILFAKSENIQDNIGTCYFAVMLACVGLYPINPGGNAWTVNNLAGPTKKAQGIAFMISMGSIGGIFGSYIYVDKEKPTYPSGYGASFGFAALGILSCFALEFGYWRENRKRAKMTESEVRGRYTQEELDAMGDRSPLLRYTL